MITAHSIVQSGDLIGAVTEDVFISDEERYLAVAQILINHPHIDLNKKDPEGKTALHWACSNNNYEKIAQEIIERQADCNVVDDFGNTPLLIALDNFCLDTVRLLLENGADPQLSQNENTCYSLAQDKNLNYLTVIFENIISKNKKRSTYSQQTYNDAKLLYSAILKNDYKKVESLLLAHPKMVDYQNKNGATPLHWAIESQHLEVVDCVLNHHPNCELSTWDGNTALHVACQDNLWQIAKSILKHNLTIAHKLTSRQNIDELNPIQLSILANSRNSQIAPNLLETFEVVAPHCGLDTLNTSLTDTAYGLPTHPELEKLCQVFLSNGANINAKDQEGRTLLHWIANEPENKVEFIWWLIDNGADPTILDCRSLKAQDIASPQHEGVIEAYVSKRALESVLNAVDVEKPTTPRKI